MPEAIIKTAARIFESGRLLVIFFAAFALIIIIRNWWLISIRRKFIENIKWETLEIKIPKDNLKSPKAMEQVFSSLYGTYSGGIKRKDKWFKGKIEDWMSVELVGLAHGIHFYIRFPVNYKDLVKSAIFSQYTGAELHEVEDYTSMFGLDLPNDEYDLFGTDFVLAREDVYPIKTYPFFEEIDEEKRLDPIATIAEAMSNLKEDETIWLQILIRPTGDEWKKKAQEIIDEIMGRKKAPPPGWLGQIISSIGEFMSNLTLAANQYPVWSTGKAGDDKPGPNKILTPGERDILEAVENKISKLGFETLVRFVYLDKKDSFTPSNVSAVMGAMRQFSTQNLNSFRPNPGTITILARNLRGYLFRHSKLKKKKKKLFAAYRNRTMPLHPKPRVALKLKTSVLNTEELATIYHPPITSVGAPSLRHLESKKGGPPPNLPIE